MLYIVKNKKVIFSVTVAVLIIIITFLNVFKNSGIATATVTNQDIFDSIICTGLIKSNEQVEIKAEVSGKIIDNIYEEGDYVNQGEIIARIENKDILNATSQAQIKLSSAKNRLNWLETGEVIQKQELLNQANYEYQLLELQYQTALENLNNGVPENNTQEIYIRAEKNLEQAQKNFEISSKLYEAGVISKDDFEKEKHNLELAQSLLNESKNDKDKVQDQYSIQSLKIKKDSAYSKVKIAQNNLDSIKKDGIEYKTAKIDYETAEKDFNNWKEKLEKTYIKSPIDGVITKKNFNTNETVSEGNVLFDIEDTKKVYIETLLDEKYALKVIVGQKVNITSLNVTGKVYSVNPSIDTANGTFKVLIAFNNEQIQYKLNMSLGLEIITKELKSQTVIDSKYYDNDNGGVYLLKDGKEVFIKSAIEQMIGDKLILDSQVKEGDILIIPSNK